jgi:ribosome-binding factor A
VTRGRTSAPGQRQLRVGEAIRHALVRILARGDLRDPALAHTSITVTEVRVSPDLKHAIAFVTPFGGGDAGALAKACRHAAGYFRSQLGHELTLRNVPAITFEPDRSFENAQRIDALLHAARPLDDQGGAKDGNDADGGAPGDGNR